MHNKKETNAIALGKLLQRGVHIEKAFEFESSIFEGVFRNAGYSVERIVKDNRLKAEERYREDRFREIEILNVISFIGQRGTGKTSVILSFQKALEEYNSQRSYGREENIKFDKEAGMEDVRFFTLDQIDASVLEESEDVFILVLAGMYRYLKSRKAEQCEGVAYQNLLNRLGEIYSDFLNLKKEKQYENGLYSSMEYLDHIASSQNIRRQFAELVESYLSYIRKTEESPCRECYLVVTIDDVDMAHYNEKRTGDSLQRQNTKSYEIINSIHKYLTIPGVIVLTAYNYINLMRQNWNFFSEHDRPKRKQQSVYEDGNESATLAAQFMDKVFSLDYRIYMPSWRKNDFEGQGFLINVKTKCLDKDNIFFQYSHLIEEDKYLTVEEFIYVLYAAKTGIYFSCNNEGNHYLEPNSLRNLVSIVKLFEFPGYELEQDATNGSQEEYRKNVFMRIKFDAYFRFAQENLFFSNAKIFFDELMLLCIDRRSRKIVRRFCGQFTRLGKNKKNLERELGKSEELKKIFDNSNVDYSFAELVHILYHISREKGEGGNQLVSCILYSYSIGLSEIYDIYRKEICEASKEEIIEEYRYEKDGKRTGKFKALDVNYEILKGVIGRSICGHWAEYYFPEVYPVFLERRRQKALVLGCADTGGIEFRVSVGNMKSGNGKLTGRDVIKQFTVCALMYADVLDWKNVEFDVRLGEKQQYSISFIVPERHELEMTAYMNYAFLYRDFLWKLEKLLSEAIQTECAKIGSIKQMVTSEEKAALKQAEDILISLQKAVNEEFKELWGYLVQWDQDYGAMMFPIHNFDCAYSLLERMYIETVDRNDARQIQSGEDFWTAFDEMNEMFCCHLREIDEFYGREKETRNFYNIFTQCPFFKLFHTVRDNAFMSANMGKYITNIIGRIINNERIEEAPDEQTKEGR